MEPLQYALWDRLGESARVRDVWASTPAGVRRKRMELRTRLFEAFADASTQTGMMADADRNRLIEEYRRRLRTWERHLDAAGAVPRERPARRDDGWWWLPMDLAWAADGWFLVVLAVVVVAGIAAGLLFVPVFLLPWAYFKMSNRARCTAAVTKRRCPDCEYDLTGCPAAIETDWLEGLDVGPRCCPECSAPWPLLPPG